MPDCAPGIGMNYFIGRRLIPGRACPEKSGLFLSRACFRFSLIQVNVKPFQY